MFGINAGQRNTNRWALVAAAGLMSAAFSGCATSPRAANKDSRRRHHRAGGHHRRSRKRMVARVHRNNRANIRGCFEAASAADASGSAESMPPKSMPPESMSAEVEIHLPASGTPGSIRLLDAKTLPEGFRGCLEKVFSDLEYGQARQGSTYYQRMTFEPATAKLRLDQPVDAYHRWGLTGTEIGTVLRAQATAIDQCYEAADTSAAGEVVVTLAISAAGQLSRVGVKSSTLDRPAVESCMVEALVDTTFPPPRGGGVVVVDVPFDFRPEQGWTQQLHLRP